MLFKPFHVHVHVHGLVLELPLGVLLVVEDNLRLYTKPLFIVKPVYRHASSTPLVYYILCVTSVYVCGVTMLVAILFIILPFAI